MLVPIYTPVRSNWRHEFGVCVAIAFDSINIKEFIEWFEFQKMLGVGEVNIYNGTITSESVELFNMYKPSGLRVFNMPPPKPYYTRKGAKMSSPASLNDCMLRNMYRYRYIIVVDFDEFITPVNHLNYSSMLQSIDKYHKLTDPWMSYTFRNAYHMVETTPTKSDTPYLKTSVYTKRAPENKFLFAPKSFVDPRQCLSVFNHFCYVRFPNSPKQFTIDVDTKIALSHHYRKCNFGKTECSKIIKSSTHDNVFDKFKPKLAARVANAFKKLNIPL
jgi:hypothetical protein